MTSSSLMPAGVLELRWGTARAHDARATFASAPAACALVADEPFRRPRPAVAQSVVAIGYWALNSQVPSLGLLNRPRPARVDSNLPH